MRFYTSLLIALFCTTGLLASSPVLSSHTISVDIVSPPSDKQMKREALLTSKKWICLSVSKKRLTKKLSFEVGNECNFSIDKKYAFKNNNYDYSNGTWKMDGKYLYFFYNAPGTENKTETISYKIIKLSESELILKRTDRPKGKLTFK